MYQTNVRVQDQTNNSLKFRRSYYKFLYVCGMVDIFLAIATIRIFYFCTKNVSHKLDVHINEVHIAALLHANPLIFYTTSDMLIFINIPRTSQARLVLYIRWIQAPLTETIYSSILNAISSVFLPSFSEKHLLSFHLGKFLTTHSGWSIVRCSLLSYATEGPANQAAKSTPSLFDAEVSGWDNLKKDNMW